MAGGGGGYRRYLWYTELNLYLEFSDGRSFNFHDGGDSYIIFMDDKPFHEFGWAPSAVEFSKIFPTVTSLWDAACDKDNKGKHICCAIAAVIYYLHYKNKCRVSWNLINICNKLNIEDR